MKWSWIIIVNPFFLPGQNLVPNYSFECNTCCPTGLTYGSSINCVKSWDLPTGGSGSSDYWACPSSSGTNYGTPTNVFGNQAARTGNAYGGIYVYNKGLQYREYLQAPLIQPLQQGKCYELSFYVSMADIRSEYGVDRMGAYLSVGAVAQLGSNPILVTPQVENPSGIILGSYTNWMKISGTFTASGGENFITIGNFYDDANTTVTAFKPFPWFSYYWVDDVTLVECGNDTLTICSGNSATLSAQGGSQYSWNTGAITPSINVSPTSTTVYTVAINDTTNCSLTVDTFIVKTAALPLAAINSYTNVSCFGLANGAAMGSASGGLSPYSYTWLASSQTTPLVTGLSAGSYSLMVTDSNGCKGTSIVLITEPPVLTSTFSSTNALCQTSGSGTATAQTSGGTVFYSYLWSNGQTNSTATGLTPGNYSVTVTDINGCTITSTVTVGAATPIIININPSPQICSGQSVTLTSNVAGGAPSYSYSWSNGSTLATATVSPTTLTNYSLTVTDANGCTNNAITGVTVNPLPTINFSGDVTDGCVPLCVNFSSTGTPAVSYSWNLGNGATSTLPAPIHCYQAPGNYAVSLTITDANGCTNSIIQNNYIHIYPNPVASFTANPQPTTLINSTILFIDQSSPAIHWNWNFGDVAGDSSTIQHPYYTYSDTGNYTVTLIITDANGCRDTTEQIIRIAGDYAFYLPNSFSPNGDGLNDIFIPKGIGMNVKDFEFYIFDRWGNLIFTSYDLNTGWNGRVKGNSDIVQIDTYVWKINIKNTEGGAYRYTGHVNVIK